MKVLADDLRPSQIITRDSLENAIATRLRLGRLDQRRPAPARRRARGRDRARRSTTSTGSPSSTPLLADLKPGGRFVATDLYEAGGVGCPGKRLDEAGLLHRDAITVTGRRSARRPTARRGDPGQEVVRPLADPLKPTGGLVILRGNLAPDGCVVKVAGDGARAATPARRASSSPRRTASPPSRSRRSSPATWS